MAASPHLVFRERIPVSPHLVFGVPAAGGGGGGTGGAASGNALLPALLAAALARLECRALGAAPVPAVGVAAGTGTYDPNAWRALTGGAGLRLGAAIRRSAAQDLTLAPTVRLSALVEVRSDAAQRRGHRADLAWIVTGRLWIAARPALGRAEHRSQAAVLPWGITARLWRSGRTDIGTSDLKLAATARAVWRPTERYRQAWVLPFGAALGLGAANRISLIPGQPLRCAMDLWWRRAGRLYWGEQPLVRIVLPLGPSIASPHLIFRGRTPASPHLVFGRNPVYRYLPSLENYLVVNTAYVKIVSTDEPIECFRVSISGDHQSWGRRFSGEAAWQERDKLALAGGPVEIEIGANGIVWRGLVTATRKSQQFGAETLSFDGVSLSALLASPYADTASFVSSSDRTAQQLALDLLPVDWALEWHTVDWLIPAGIFSLQQGAPMDGIKRLAEAAGAYVQTARATRTLAVERRYPALPWHWPELPPDVALPLDAVQSLGSEWTSKPAYDGVYVSGQSVGVNAYVMRDGTGGANLAPMVVDPLITHRDANRARGEAILSDTGHQEMVTLVLAVYPEIGVIDPGALVNVGGEWSGLCRGTAVDLQWTEPEGLTITQTLQLERHYG